MSPSARLERAIAWLFGGALCMLSLVVVIEVLLRKGLLVSLQGVDELSGYVLAVVAALAFFMAMLDRGHMRIDIFYAMMPRPVRLFSDGLAVLSMAVGAVLVGWMAWITLSESREFNSVSQTPWATPMVIPQTVWLLALLPFVLLALVSLLRFAGALIRRDAAGLAPFVAKGSEDELQEQLQALQERGTGSSKSDRR
jgi:TRAP-type C4-dicarboxylate transport system permease small subunit